GSAADHAAVLENPDVISKAVLAKKLDSQTAFEIVSIDIADIDVGANIGARLQADQAEADTAVARANAEMKRAAAVAEEQEMQAKIEKSRADVVEAQAAVPKAMADAFRTGKLMIMDYYRLQNVNADTEMRRALAGSTSDYDESRQERRENNR
ncbi:MAG: flotillin-like FloA family protein, partial [Planctomycetota bacterium]